MASRPARTDSDRFSGRRYRGKGQVPDPVVLSVWLDGQYLTATTEVIMLLSTSQ